MASDHLLLSILYTKMIKKATMDLTSLTQVKNLLHKYNAYPSKGMGQNFLINKKTLQTIIKAANLHPQDTVLEVGPGIGILTQELAQQVKQITAIEKDRNMVEILKETMKDYPNVEVLNQDILAFLDSQNSFQKSGSYKVVANIPYYLTSPLIRKLLESPHQPQEIILMVQKEVAQRITAAPPNMNLLAVSVQYYATPKIIAYVSKECFWPKPKIDSAIIRITPIQQSKDISYEKFFRIVRAGFSQPRKQLANNLSQKLKMNREEVEVWLSKNNINPKQRAETLTIKDWEGLTHSEQKFHTREKPG